MRSVPAISQLRLCRPDCCRAHAIARVPDLNATSCICARSWPHAELHPACSRVCAHCRRAQVEAFIRCTDVRAQGSGLQAQAASVKPAHLRRLAIHLTSQQRPLLLTATHTAAANSSSCGPPRLEQGCATLSKKHNDHRSGAWIVHSGRVMVAVCQQQSTCCCSRLAFGRGRKNDD